MTHPQPQDTAPREVFAALDTLLGYLREDFIMEGCRKAPTFNCASCSAIALEQQLTGLRNYLDEEASRP